MELVDGWNETCPLRPTVAELIALLACDREDGQALRDAIAPDAPLVELGLVSLLGGERTPHEQREIWLDDRVAGFLRGETELDRRLAEFATLHDREVACDLAAAARIERALETAGPIVVEGPARVGKVAAAITAIARRAPALVCEVDALMASEDPMGRLVAVRRELVFQRARLVLRVRAWDPAWPAALRRQLVELVEQHAVLAIRDGAPLVDELAGVRKIVVAMPALAIQAEVWRATLGDIAGIEAACARYPLPPGDIAIAAAEVRAEAELAGRAPTADDILAAARLRLRHRLGDVAELVSTRLSWSDVVLRDDVGAKVRELIDVVRLRDRVLGDWGFEAKLPYGRSISALLSGAPGTGKTMVATILGKELGLEVFRVDLSKVTSKYIGETEKNLARVFDEATRCRAILLFDEADSLFAKRTEVRSSNDKFANLEVNFLLQRLETHDGVVVLTTNAATAIDRAFLRRIAFRIEFPEPDEHERARLWRSMIPDRAPLAADVDFAVLGRTFSMTGGHIKNAVVRAAYRAMTSGRPAIDQATLHQSGLAEWTELGNLSMPSGIESTPAPVTPPPAPSPARGSAPTITRLIPSPAPVKPAPSKVETEVLSILTSRLHAGETIESGYRRKETEIVTALAALTIVEARALQRRLEIAAGDDVLAQQFARLSRDRRQRVISFLGDARRRQAIAAAS